MEIYGPVKLRGTLADGTGDELVTKNASSDELGTAANALGSLTSAYIYVGNASNLPVGVAVTGDIGITNAGVASITAGAIVDADVNTSAAIAYSKLAALTASRALVSNASGVVSVSSVTDTALSYVANLSSDAQTQISGKQATITGAATTVVSSNLGTNKAVISNGSGKLDVSTVTTTELGYISGLSSSAQTQLNSKLSATISSAATGDIIYYNGTAWVNLPRGTDGQTLRSSSTTILWDTPTINGIPIGGTANQVLAKQSGTDFDADWETLTVSSITDLTATAAELNILDGATISTSELNFLDNASANIQDQLNNKMSSALATDSIYKGVGGVATATTDLPTGITIGSAVIYRVGGSDVTLADGGTGASLADPDADRIMFWDDSAGAVAWLTAGTGLTITGTTIDATGGISGTISLGQVAYASGSNAIKGEAVFTYNETNDELSVRRVKTLSSATYAAIAETGVTGADPSTLSDGDRWYRTDTDEFRGRANGASVSFLTSAKNTSGVYTPTCTSVANLDATPTPVTSGTRWIRIGNIVTVSGSINADPTATGTAAQFRMSLPVASNFSGGGVEQCCGSGTVFYSTGTIIDQAIITGDVVNDEATILFYPSQTNLGGVRFTFSYEVV